MKSMQPGMFFRVELPKAKPNTAGANTSDVIETLVKKEADSSPIHCPVLFSFFYGDDSSIDATETKIK